MDVLPAMLQSWTWAVADENRRPAPIGRTRRRSVAGVRPVAGIDVGHVVLHLAAGDADGAADDGDAGAAEGGIGQSRVSITVALESAR